MTVRLSRIQEQLWLAEQLGAHPSGFLVPMVLEISGPVDIPALEAALVDIVDRHQVLRTRYFEVDGELRGEVRTATEFTLETETDSNDIDAMLAAETTEVMDLSQDIPIRARLVRRHAQCHILSVVVHHIAFDDWSRNQFYAELSERYRAHISGARQSPATEGVQYHEYAVNRDERDASCRERSLKYWRGVLTGMEPFEVEADYLRPARRQGRGAEATFEIAPDLAGKLARVASSCGATTPMVLFAAVQAALHRFTGRREITCGTTIARRDEDDSLELIGPLVNTVVLRTDMSGSPAFTDVVSQMRDALLDAMEHSDVPFNELVAEHVPTVDMSRNPLAQVMVQFGSGVHRQPQLEGCTVLEQVVEATGSKYDLTFLFDQREDGRVITEIGWDRDLYKNETMNSLADTLRTVIDSVAIEPDTGVNELRVLPASTESTILAQQSGGHTHPADMSLHQLIEAQVQLRPFATALLADDGREWSYQELDELSSSIAARLHECGIGRESIVAVHAHRSVEQIAALLGVLKAGAAFLALDPEYPVERNRFMLHDAQVDILLFHGDVPPEIKRQSSDAFDIRQIFTGKGTFTPPGMHPDSGCTLIYTSGSTGRPKGVLLTHKGLTGKLTDSQSEFPLAPSDRMLLKASCAFDMSLTELFWPLIAGATVVLAKPGGHRDPTYLIDRMAQTDVTVASFVPSMLSLMAGNHTLSACDSLRMLYTGGEEVHRTVIDQTRDRLPQCSIYNAYGPTEVSIYSSWRHCDGDVPGETVVEPLGSPLPNTQMYVLDEWLDLVPPGGVGELYIGGPGLARGYIGRPGLTAERFVPNPFGDGDRLYRTGDAVRYLIGSRSFQFLGRTDFQIKIGGVRIEIGEIETVLCTHTAVEECAVVVKKDDNGQTMHAFVTLQRDVEPSDLLNHARTLLPPIAVPTTITIMDALPTLPNGKVNRRQLRETDVHIPEPAVRVEEMTEHQEALAQIWGEVLHTSAITVNSDFFASGGHSLLAIQMTNRTREMLDLEVPLSLVFEAPVLGDYCARIDAMNRVGS